jgi:hypothetical protein
MCHGKWILEVLLYKQINYEYSNQNISLILLQMKMLQQVKWEVSQNVQFAWASLFVLQR